TSLRRVPPFVPVLLRHDERRGNEVDVIIDGLRPDPLFPRLLEVVQRLAPDSLERFHTPGIVPSDAELGDQLLEKLLLVEEEHEVTGGALIDGSRLDERLDVDVVDLALRDREAPVREVTEGDRESPLGVDVAHELLEERCEPLVDP